MANRTKKLIDRALGARDPREEGFRRTLTGLREGNRTELYTGLALTALAYISRTRPQRQLLFRKSLPEGSALVIHHKKRGAPRIEVIKPPKG
ncbi:MAG TPA: hypothetical protein VFS66_00970 [Acidimicrobiia bacterium]|nr:hypothetical protein [Acidimicrobiia bacterium]